MTQLYSKKYTPDHRIYLQRRENNFLAEDITGDVVSIVTSKKLGAGGGGWQLSLTFAKRFENKRYDQLIKTNDIITIELYKGSVESKIVGDDSKQSFIPVMVGLVDRTSRSISVANNGKPVRRVAVHGTEMGKILTGHNCGWDLAKLTEADGDPLAIRLSMNRWQMSGTASQNMIQVLNNLFYAEVGDWVKNYIFPDFISDDEWLTYNKTIQQKSGSAWAAMKGVANEPYNVLYTLTKPDGLFYIRHHRQPFLLGEVAKLDPELVSFYEIEEREIIKEDVGISDADRINYASFENYESLFGANGLAYTFAKFAKWDDASVEAHGFKPFRPQTDYVPPNKPESTESANSYSQRVMEERTTTLWNWFKKSHEYESGTFIIHGDPAVQIGQGLIVKDTGMEYYIENVGHRYDFKIDNTTYQTILSVTRGQSHGA